MSPYSSSSTYLKWRGRRGVYVGSNLLFHLPPFFLLLYWFGYPDFMAERFLPYSCEPVERTCFSFFLFCRCCSQLVYVVSRSSPPAKSHKLDFAAGTTSWVEKMTSVGVDALSEVVIIPVAGPYVLLTRSSRRIDFWREPYVGVRLTTGPLMNADVNTRPFPRWWKRRRSAESF